MRVNEIKETREVVIRTEYIAKDGEVFRTQEEAEKYEKSALFAVRSRLNNLFIDRVTEYDINECGCEETYAELFECKTENDLQNIIKYMLLISDEYDHSKIKGYAERIKVGEPILVFQYDDSVWIYGNGTIQGYLDYIQSNIAKYMKPINNNN